MRNTICFSLVMLSLALPGCAEKPVEAAVRYLNLSQTVYVPVEMKGLVEAAKAALAAGRTPDVTNSAPRLATVSQARPGVVPLWFYQEHATGDVTLMETTPQQVLEMAIADPAIAAISVGEGQRKPVRLERAEFEHVLGRIGPAQRRQTRIIQ